MNETTTAIIEPFLTEEQTRIASLIHLTTAPLSVWGSGFIIYSIWKDRKVKMRRAYQRLMLGLSMMDLISSLSLVLTMPWLAPAELGNELVFQAYGNFTTCAISSFFYNFMIGASCYSVCLSVFFLTQVRYEMREERFTKRIEPFFHAFSILAPIATGIIGALGQHLNPVTAMPGLCFTQEFPTGCAEDEDIPCIRGEGAHISNRMFGVFAGVSFVIIIVSMVLILCKVGATEKKIRQYGQGTQRGMIRTRQTGRQALMYIGAFFFWFFPFVPVNRLQADAEYGDTKYFISLLALRTISPLQGFFNALIYRRRMGGAETRRSTISNIRQSSLASTSRISKLFSRKSEASASLDSPAHGLSEASSNMISQRNDSAHSVNLTAESIDELEEDDEEKVGSIASENNESEIVQDQDYGETSHDLDAKEDNQPSNPETVEPNRETSGRHSRVDMTGSIDERVNN